MSRALETWLEGLHIGRFTANADGSTTFTYNEDAPATPISLSLPRDGGATRRAPANFLDNLLPDHEATRDRMATAYGATSASTFDLLSKAGGDIAGGLVLLPEGQAPVADLPMLDPALERDIAARIAAIKRDPDAWAATDTPARFSLAGTQGKFALADIEGEWYWSNATVPSTHIIKPANPTLRGLERAETAAVTLAASVGIAAPPAWSIVALDQTAYIVKRFDRTGDGAIAERIHAEDLAQALGIGLDSKYHVSAKQSIELLKRVDGTGELAYSFIRLLAFNTVIGNADAHAKNYSVLLRPSGIELAPIYDAVPVMLYPEYNQELAMKIGGARYAQEVEISHWRRLASITGLDPDRVTAIAVAIASKVAERSDDAWDMLDDDQSQTMREALKRTTEKLTARL